MAIDWEDTFRSWAKPPSETEQQRCDNAERMVREAIKVDSVLSKKGIEVFPQGSYKHNTNVKQDSDVDICVRLMDTFFYELPTDRTNTPQYFGIVSSPYSYADYKNAVETALVNKFGKKSVTRGNKAFNVRESSYRVDADVVACFEHRRYTGRFNPDGSCHYHSGTEFRADNGHRLINWPIQSYENGVRKNKQTGNRFKYVIRILKRLRNKMQDQRITTVYNIASFLIECLVWNVPNDGFASDLFKANIRWVLAHTFNETLTDEGCSEWGEINELKYLFRLSQPWTRQQAHDFLSSSWKYIGFE